MSRTATAILLFVIGALALLGDTVTSTATTFAGAAALGCGLLVAGFVVATRRSPVAFLVAVPAVIITWLLMPLFAARSFNTSSIWPVDLSTNLGAAVRLVYPAVAALVAGVGFIVVAQFPRQAGAEEAVTDFRTRPAPVPLVGYTADGQPV